MGGHNYGSENYPDRQVAGYDPQVGTELTSVVSLCCPIELSGLVGIAYSMLLNAVLTKFCVVGVLGTGFLVFYRSN